MRRIRSGKLILTLVVVAVLVAASRVLPIRDWVAAFLDWIRGLGIAGAVLYAVVYAGGTVLLIPGTALTAGAGLLYGTLVGTLIVSPASVCGATAAFLIGRHFARGWVESKLSDHQKFAAIDRAIANHGFKVVLLLRLQPVFLPFAVLNYALGLTRVRLRDYILGSWLGMLPATILYVYLGSAVHSVPDLMHGRLPSGGLAKELLFWGGLVALGLLVFLLGRVARRALAQEVDGAREERREQTLHGDHRDIARSH
jgi:uncharacterized membrane protein YdjX (TVP38/TMEM64 family)